MTLSTVVKPDDNFSYVENEKNILLKKAESVFSKSYVDILRKKEMAILENDSEGAFLQDSEGNKYLDCYTSAGMFNLGRKQPDICKALKTASQATDQGNFVAVSEEKALFAARLAEFMPETLDCFLFTVVRGEAMDVACKLARGYTERSRLITVDGGSYGETGFAISLSDNTEKNQFGSLIPGIEKIRFNDVGSLAGVIDKSCAAVILEPIQAEYGCRVADREWLKGIRALCDNTGTLLIFDETQTGFGRTGKKFASELCGITPDIMVFGEAVTGGLFPLTGIAFNRKVKHFFDIHPLIHLCTFGGHDVGCRTAVAALELYDRIQPWENAERKGQEIYGRIEGLIKDHPDVAGIQGTGLLISIIFNSSDSAGAFCLKARKAGLFVVQGQIAKESVVLRPVLTLSDSEADMLINAVKASLET